MRQLAGQRGVQIGGEFRWNDALYRSGDGGIDDDLIRLEAWVRNGADMSQSLAQNHSVS